MGLFVKERSQSFPSTPPALRTLTASLPGIAAVTFPLDKGLEHFAQCRNARPYVLPRRVYDDTSIPAFILAVTHLLPRGQYLSCDVG